MESQGWKSISFCPTVTAGYELPYDFSKQLFPALSVLLNAGRQQITREWSLAHCGSGATAAKVSSCVLVDSGLRHQLPSLTPELPYIRFKQPHYCPCFHSLCGIAGYDRTSRDELFHLLPNLLYQPLVILHGRFSFSHTSCS